MFLQPIHPKIVNELRRREAIANGYPYYLDAFSYTEKKVPVTNQERLHYLSGKMPFVRMVSYASIMLPEKFGYKAHESDLIRLNHILYAGEVSAFGLDSSVKSLSKKLTTAHHYGRLIRGGDMAYEKYDYEKDTFVQKIDGTERSREIKSYSFNANDKVLRLMPGIESVDIDNKGRFGSLREANVKFKVFSIYQLELYQLLYMTPGVHVSLEWGWSGYQIEEVLPIEDPKKIKELLDSGAITKYAIENNGNYDALVGLVQNFNYSRGDGGSWDCSVSIISPGAAPLQFSRNDSIGVKYIIDFFNNKIVGSSPTISQYLNGASEISRDGSAKVFKMKTVDFLKGFGEQIPQILQREKIFDNDNQMGWVFAITGAKGKFEFNEKKGKKGEELPPGLKAEKKATKTFNGKIYVSLGMVEAVVNAGLLLIPSDTSKMQLFKIENYDKKYIYPMFIKNHHYLLSLNPNVMVLPGKAQKIRMSGDYSKVQSRNFIDLGEKFNFDLHPSHMEDGYEIPIFMNGEWKPYQFKEKDKYYYGNIRNILVNLNTVLEAFYGGMSLQNSLKKLMFDIAACVPNGFWNFDVIIEDHDPKKFKLMEMNTIAFGSLTRKEYMRKEFTFKTRMGIIKSISIDVKLPDSFKAGTFVSATSNRPDAILTILRGATDIIGSMKELDPEEKIDSIIKSAGGYPSTIEDIDKVLNSLNEYKKELLSNNSAGSSGSIPNRLIKEIELLEEKRKKISSSKEYQDQQKRTAKTLEALQTGEEINPNDIELAKDFLNKKMNEELLQQEKNLNSVDIGKLYPFDTEITMDGIGGLYCGSRYFVSGLPSNYEDLVIFQIVGVKHSINSNEWTTSITGKMRPFYGT